MAELPHASHAEKPIIFAVSEGNLSLVKTLVRRDPTVIHAQDSDERTPLIYAAGEKHIDVATYLLDSGARVNHRGKHGCTALYWACDMGQRDMAALLISRGADVTLVGWGRRTPLMKAAGRGRTECVRLLLTHRCVDLDVCDAWGETALWLAACRGHTQSVSLLLQYGADPTVSDWRGWTPLRVAQETGNDECVQLLQEWERSYTLTKAGRILDDTQALPHAHTHPESHKRTRTQARLQRTVAAPAYVRTRVCQGDALPRVCVGVCGGGSGSEGSRENVCQGVNGACRDGQSSTTDRPTAAVNTRKRKPYGCACGGVADDAHTHTDTRTHTPPHTTVLHDVVRHVTHELKADLFVELIGLVGWAGACKGGGSVNTAAPAAAVAAADTRTHTHAHTHTCPSTTTIATQTPIHTDTWHLLADTHARVSSSTQTRTDTEVCAQTGGGWGGVCVCGGVMGLERLQKRLCVPGVSLEGWGSEE